jgi:diphosphomevalonate decarboxylase
MIGDKPANSLSIRYRSAPNIALVKYWGKYDEDEILPINDSIGITLNTDDLSTITTCAFVKDLQTDEFWLNGKLIEIGGRMKKVLQKIRAAARNSNAFKNTSEDEWNQFHFQIKSENSFPTASGMASSASGFSCLATALNGLFGGILDEK